MLQFVEMTNMFFEGQIDTIFEVGSLDGKDAIYFKKFFPQAKVFAVEGLPDNFQNFLKDRIDIIPINRVICNYDGEVNFYKKTINGLHSIYDRGAFYGTEKIKLPCNRLDTLCKEYKIVCIDMIKIDVEGATYDVLEGMGELIDTVKIMHVETEGSEFFQGQKCHGEVNDFLVAKGFKMIEMSSVEIHPSRFQHDSVWRKE